MTTPDINLLLTQTSSDMKFLCQVSVQSTRLALKPDKTNQIVSQYSYLRLNIVTLRLISSQTFCKYKAIFKEFSADLQKRNESFINPSN